MLTWYDVTLTIGTITRTVRAGCDSPRRNDVLYWASRAIFADPITRAAMPRGPLEIDVLSIQPVRNANRSGGAGL